MLNKWNYCNNQSHERFIELTKRFTTIAEGPTEIYDVKYNSTIELYLLLKYVYCKIILGNEQLIANQPFLNVETIIEHKKYPIVVKRQVLTDGIIMDENNNLTISYENLMKCLLILDDFQIVAMWADLVYVGGVNNYIQNYDKYITKSFCQNVEKINSLYIEQSLEISAYKCSIIFYQNSDFAKNNSQTHNVSERFDKIIDWLLERCKHIETFEIGVLAAISQTLGFTEGLEAFKKFVKYAESLDNENRVKLVNCLIDYYNGLGNVYQKQNTLQFIPQIIESLSLCDTIQDYPKSTIQLVVNGKINNMARRLINITEDLNDFAKLEFFAKALKDFRYNPENFVDSSKFDYNRTVPIRTLIDISEKLF